MSPLPITDSEHFSSLALPDQLRALRPVVEANLLEMLQSPDPVDLCEILHLARHELGPMDSETWARWCSLLEAAFVIGLLTGQQIASFRPDVAAVRR